MHKFKTVSDFLQGLDEMKGAQVEELRDIILAAEPKLIEHIKWNAPSYAWDGNDRITFNVLNKEGTVKLVLHMGGIRREKKKAEPVLEDTAGIVEWISDIRGTLSFEDLNDIKLKRESTESVLKSWLAIKPC